MAANTRKDSKKKAGKAAGAGTEASAAGYAREAVSQWATAAKLGVAAVAAKRATGGGAGVMRRAAGATADWALSKTGTAGKVASKLSMGRRAVGATGNGGGDEVELGGDETAVASIPIQESVEIAVPVGLAYRLALGFEDYPQFLSHVDDVAVDGDEVEFDAKLRGTSQAVAIEVFDARENERIDWRGTHGIAHAGTASFHELAPRLTHVELSVDLEPQGPGQRLARALRITDHTVRNELRRFKAYAELYEDEGDAEFEPESEAEASDEPEDAEGQEEEEGEEESAEAESD